MGRDVAVLHCTTRYPTPPQDEGLNVMLELSGLSPVFGLSDHSGTIYPAVVASYLGASMIEVHLAMHRSMFGPDVSASLVPEDLAALVRGVEFAWQMRTHPVVKESQLGDLSRERKIFGRSLVAARPIAAGDVVDEAALASKKPGGGLTYEEMSLLLGKRAKLPLERDAIIRIDDVE
jgi:N-acetylneuraminate synthase